MTEFETGWAAARARAVEELQKEAREYEAQFGTSGAGGHTAAVLVHAAQIIDEALGVTA